MRRMLITGSNRGIGLEFVRQYLEDGWRVYATCRHPSDADELERLNSIYSGVSIHRLDITVQEDLMAIVREMKDVPIDLLINNAGVFFTADSATARLPYEKWRRMLEVNTLGTVRTIETFEENICLGRNNRLVVVITRSLQHSGNGGWPEQHCHRSSKAALNTVMQGLAVELKRREIGVLLLEPGDVMTRIGSAGGISPRRSVEGMRAVIDGFRLSETGSLIRYDGTVLDARNAGTPQDNGCSSAARQSGQTGRGGRGSVARR